MTVKQQEEQIGKLAREVVLKRASIVAAIAVVLNIAEVMGWIVPNVSANVQNYVSHGFDLASFIGAAFYVRAAVTPADPKLNPTSTSGTALVEAHAYEVPTEALIPTQPTYITNVYSAPADDSSGAHAAPVDAPAAGGVGDAEVVAPPATTNSYGEPVPAVEPVVAAEAALPTDTSQTV